MDAVYFVRPGRNEELRYSLRSIKNIHPNKVWIYGSCPEWCKPDGYVHVDQVGNTKWDRVKNMYRGVCENPEISDDFILMNDDFFILKPTEIEPLYRCSLYQHIVENELAFGFRVTEYARELLGCLAVLKSLGCSTNSYELHIPIVFNKKKLLELLKKYPEVHATRSLYYNIYGMGGKRMDDVKVNTPGSFKRPETFLSSSDESFDGLVGDYIKKQFQSKGKYETD